MLEKLLFYIFLLFQLATFAFHLLVTFLPFLVVGPPNHQLKYYILSYTGRRRLSAGYHFVDPTTLKDIQNIPTAAQEMTKGLILHPIAAIISFVAVVLSFLSSPWYRLALGLIAHLMTITAWALTFSFVVACQKYSGINIPAKYGLAFWFTQVALVTSSAAAMLNYYTRKYKAEAKAEAEAAKK